MMSRQSARSLLLAIGLTTLALAPDLVRAQAPDDPIQKPLWRDAAEATTALDSLPARLSRYQLLSFPQTPNPNTVSGIFGDELGAYNTTVWRLGHWLPSLSGTNKYQEPNAFTSVEHGLGYWLITRDSVKVRFDGTATVADTFELPLIQGPNGAPEFNQLGNPFGFATGTAVTNWRVVKRDSLLTLGQAATRTWIDANMRIWNPNTSQYTAAGTIPRGQGFFARIIDPDTSLQWTRWVVNSGNYFGFWSSVRIDSKGNPHIVYYVDSSGDLRYATRKNNTWTDIILDTTTDSFNGVWASIELDSLDNPFIAYNVQFGGRPFFIRRQSNGTWTLPEQIEPGPSNGFLIKIKLWHGIPRVVYVNNATGLLKYAERASGGGWNIETVNDVMGGNVNFNDGDLGFDIDRDTGRPHIAAPSRNSPYSLRYATKTGTTWTSEVVDTLASGSTGLTPSLAVDNAGNPHIAYFDAAAVDLKYAKKSGSTWTLETVDATGTTGQYSEVLLDAANVPSIAFLEYASMGVPNRIRYTRRGSTSWGAPETVDDVNVSSNYAFIGATLDSKGQPRVTYQGNVSDPRAMRYAEKIRGTWRIKIPPVAAPEPPVASEAKPEGAEWAVAITARQGERAAEPMVLGVAPSADVSAALRSWKAPAPPQGELLSLHVPRGEDELVRDFQRPAETVSWTFATAGGVAPGEQTLSFEGFDLPAGLRLFLTDSDNGWTREVHAGESVTLAARPRTLELVATRNPAGVPVSAPGTGLSFAYPNPFAANTGLAFRLAQAGDLRVDVYDITGRRVRSIERTGAGPGEHVLVWDGRDADGRAVPSGVYLARWSAGATSGSRRLVKVE